MMEDESILESRIENGSRNAEDYLSLGKVYLDRGDYDKLLELYARTSTLPLSDEERAIILYEKGQAYRLSGKKEDAISCCEEYLELFGNEKDDLLLAMSGLNYYNLSLLSLYQLDQEEKSSEYAKRALEAFETLLQKYPDYEEKTMVYAHISELYGRFEEYGKAIDSCKKAIETARNGEERMDSLLILGSINMGKENYQEAEEAYRQAFMLAKEEKDLSRIYFEYGKMCFVSNRIQDAIEAFNNAMKFMKSDPLIRDDKGYAADILWYLGSLYFEKQEYDRAMEYMERTLECIEENHVYKCNIYITLGHCYFAKGDYTMAQGYYNNTLLSPLATKEEIDMANESLDESLKNIEKNMGLE
jgi:tetratricopeptide (TPR) repeat protein